MSNPFDNEELGSQKLNFDNIANFAQHRFRCGKTKVTMKGIKQVMQMFGPAQFAVTKAVADSVVEGFIPQDKAENLLHVCGVFIQSATEDHEKIYKYNY